MCIDARIPGSVLLFMEMPSDHESSPPPLRTTADRPALTGMVISQVDPGHAMNDGICVAVRRLQQTARAAPNAPRSHEDDHI